MNPQNSYEFVKDKFKFRIIIRNQLLCKCDVAQVGIETFRRGHFGTENIQRCRFGEWILKFFFNFKFNLLYFLGNDCKPCSTPQV